MTELIGDSLAIMLSKEPKLTTKTVTANGTYKAADEPVSQGADKYDGYSQFTANIRTYEDELAEALAALAAMQDCFDDVADIIEENTGVRPEDCDDVKDALEDAYEGAHLINPITITDNGTYTASGNVDGYSPVTVALPLGTKTVTENGTYTASTDSLKGYSAFTVNVDTYEEEYEEAEEQLQEMLECQAEIAALLGLTPPYDCEDIKQAITERGGYEPPIGTEINDILSIAKADPVTDETVGKTIVTIINNDGGVGRLYVRVRYTDGSEDQIFGREYGDVAFDDVEYAILDSSTGRIAGSYTYHSPGGTSTTETFDYTKSALIGYGAAGHQYKVQNQ